MLADVILEIMRLYPLTHSCYSVGFVVYCIYKRKENLIGKLKKSTLLQICMLPGIIN
jgi:hypothetical protein